MTSQQELAARYGTDRSRIPGRVGVTVLVVTYLAVAAWAALSLSQRSVEGTVLGWQSKERFVSVDLEVRGQAPDGVKCVIKATDGQSVDVGYHEVTTPAPPVTIRADVPTVIKAASVTVLGCAPVDEELRVTPPDFPPGVAVP